MRQGTQRREVLDGCGSVRSTLPRPEPISRRASSDKEPLSRAVIVARALGLVDSEAGLTMRRLAAELDTGAASLYVYFRSTDEIKVALLEELLGSLNLKRGRRAWRRRLIDLLVDYIELLYAHPELARTALITRPSGPNAMALLDAVLGLLAEGGLAVRRAAWLVDLLLQQATATAAEHGTRAAQPPGTDDVADQAEAIRHAEREGLAHVAAAAGELMSGTVETRRVWALDVLVSGAFTASEP